MAEGGKEGQPSRIVQRIRWLKRPLSCPRQFSHANAARSLLGCAPTQQRRQFARRIGADSSAGQNTQQDFPWYDEESAVELQPLLRPVSAGPPQDTEEEKQAHRAVKEHRANK